MAAVNPISEAECVAHCFQEEGEGGAELWGPWDQAVTRHGLLDRPMVGSQLACPAILPRQYGWTMPKLSSLRLYREILREVAGLSPAPLRRKITRNTREAFAHHRSAPGHRLAELHEDGRAVLTVIRWLKTIPEVGVWGWLGQ